MGSCPFSVTQLPFGILVPASVENEQMPPPHTLPFYFDLSDPRRLSEIQKAILHNYNDYQLLLHIKSPQNPMASNNNQQLEYMCPWGSYCGLGLL